jgi:hypothetical protein
VSIAHREQHALQTVGQNLRLQATTKQAEDSILRQHFLRMPFGNKSAWFL